MQMDAVGTGGQTRHLHVHEHAGRGRRRRPPCSNVTMPITDPEGSTISAEAMSATTAAGAKMAANATAATASNFVWFFTGERSLPRMSED